MAPEAQTRNPVTSFRNALIAQASRIIRREAELQRLIAKGGPNNTARVQILRQVVGQDRRWLTRNKYWLQHFFGTVRFDEIAKQPIEVDGGEVARD